MSKRIAFWDVCELKKGGAFHWGSRAFQCGCCLGTSSASRLTRHFGCPHLSSAGGSCQDLCSALGSGAP